MNPGTVFVVALYAVLVAVGLAGGLFLHRISFGTVKWHIAFSGAAKLFKHLARPKAFTVAALIVAGLATMFSGVSYAYIEATTGYKYSLITEQRHVYVPELGRIVTLPGYSLWEAPVTSTQVVAIVDPARPLIGLLLVIMALLIAAWSSVKAVNRAYGVE
jgi:sulfite exporter TauE/SafE